MNVAASVIGLPRASSQRRRDSCWSRGATTFSGSCDPLLFVRSAHMCLLSLFGCGALGLVVCDLEISDRAQIADLLGREVRDGYCLSYTIVLLTARPCGSVPVWVAVRVLPSGEIVTFVIVVTFPFFLPVTS